MSIRRRKKKDPNLIQIEDKLVSGELSEEMFACDIAACKGACCVEGDVGAPLEEEELSILEKIYPKVKPYLRKEGIRSIDQLGTWIKDWTGGLSTPLVNHQECAYVTFSDEGVALCGIEQAYEAGDIDFKKPISCHLYPIRVQKYEEFEALMYDRWDICSAACVKGKVEGVKVYEFTKDALVRAYGEDFWNQLDFVVKSMENKDSDTSI
ncbi:MAG: DUF3109 family protein [Bacteroidota bacterium]